jgi:hypothetical protein
VADTRRRANWHADDPQQRLRPAFRLWKKDRAAICEVFSHPLGWELRLMVGQELVRFRVVRTEPELNATAIEWRDAMRIKGWEAVEE